MRLGMTQVELAHDLGYEQAYLSSIERGAKSPSAEFVARLNLDEKDRIAMNEALRASRRRYVLPADVSTETFVFCNALWDRLERLHPALLNAMTEILRVEEKAAEPSRHQPTRLRRRGKVEAKF